MILLVSCFKISQEQNLEQKNAVKKLLIEISLKIFGDVKTCEKMYQSLRVIHANQFGGMTLI